MRAVGGLLLHESWSEEAKLVLVRACEAHGGFANWRAVDRLRLVPLGLHGLIPWLKGAGTTFKLPARIEVCPHERVTRFEAYPDDDHRGIFVNGDVRIESSRDSTVVLSSSRHRESFRGLAKYRRWSPLDALYFFGYALWHYHVVPFTLGAARLLRSSTARATGVRCDVLEVEFPADVPTHCPRQAFYFDATGRLLRHDYRAEIIGFWARGAHYWKEYALCAGLPIALERHVVPRLGARTCPGTALHASFASAEAERGPQLRPAA